MISLKRCQGAARPRGPLGGGRPWWAHFEFTRINIAPTILPKKVEEFLNVATFSLLVEDSRFAVRSPRSLDVAADVPAVTRLSDAAHRAAGSRGGWVTRSASHATYPPRMAGAIGRGRRSSPGVRFLTFPRRLFSADVPEQPPCSRYKRSSGRATTCSGRALRVRAA
jgi:hypothetical protein